MYAQLTSKGQLVIPKAVREQLHLHTGSRLQVQVVDGTVILKPEIPSTSSLDQWAPANPHGITLSTEELCRPVELKP